MKLLSIITAFASIVFTPLCSVAAADEPLTKFSDGGKTWSYSTRTIEGWTVLIESHLLEDPKLVSAIETQLRRSFTKIKASLPADKVTFLQTIKFWASNEPQYPMREGEQATVQFHRSKGWLHEHGLNPAMENGVHMVNPAILFRDGFFTIQPESILHELAHAYHNLKLGLENPYILRAYKHAMTERLYEKVPAKNNPTVLVDAYAGSNSEEYFAELTEAFFGENDFYPWNCELLKIYDPEGYQMVATVWDVRPK